MEMMSKARSLRHVGLKSMPRLFCVIVIRHHAVVGESAVAVAVGQHFALSSLSGGLCDFFASLCVEQKSDHDEGNSPDRGGAQSTDSQRCPRTSFVGVLDIYDSFEREKMLLGMNKRNVISFIV